LNEKAYSEEFKAAPWRRNTSRHSSDAASLIDRFEHVGAEHFISTGLVEARNERALVQFASSLYVHPTSEWAALSGS